MHIDLLDAVYGIRFLDVAFDGHNLCAFGIGDFASFCYKLCSDIAADAFISLKSQHRIQDKNITVASFIKEVISRQVQSAKFRQN